MSLKRKRARLGNARNVRARTGSSHADELAAEPGSQSQTEDLHSGAGDDMQGERGLKTVTSLTPDNDGMARAILGKHEELHAT